MFLALQYLFLQAVNEKFLFRSDRIFTVLTVVLIIWVGVAFQLIWLDRRIKKLEDKNKSA